jgi:hypothetical protein
LVCKGLGGIITGLVLVVLSIIVGSSLSGSLVEEEVGSVVVRGKLNSWAVLGSIGGSVVNSSDEGGDGEELDCGEGLT